MSFSRHKQANKGRSSFCPFCFCDLRSPPSATRLTFESANQEGKGEQTENCQSHEPAFSDVPAGAAVDAGHALPHRTDDSEEARTLEATRMLWDASAAGDSQLTLLSQALDAGARVDWRDAEDRGNCALHKAAEGGAVGLVEALLRAQGCWGRGAAPSSRNAFNDSPLHAAAYKGHAAVAELLIAAQVCSV